MVGRIILVLSAPINQSQNPYNSVLSDTASFGALRGVCIALYNQVWTDRVTVGLDETRPGGLPTMTYRGSAVIGTSLREDMTKG